MEVREFQDSRKAEYDAFSKQYTFLKEQYSSTLSAAIQESDPAQREALILQVQQINSQMTEEIRGILSILNKGATGYDSKTMDELTSDLIQYQKEYDEIQKTKDKVTTLKMIHSEASKRLDSMTYSFYFYLFVLIFLCFYLAFTVITASWSSTGSWLSTVVTGQG
jgi:hypothetical protein